ncbi:MAG: hypothetical protein A3E84_03345 [Gammaproteobacteria bacterium RIFCSPHIGHO2_12_FULL_42_13]|nr:MAG: hypothetical protein A3E84_03345 [Gammaproteobacteria bacterium RIFCSPHIGHO2_12_FULL_42_13]
MHFFNILIEPFFSRLSYIRIDPTEILCISAEAAVITLLQARYPKAKITWITPIDTIPKTNYYDFIIAFFPFQTPEDTRTKIKVFHELLKIKGLLLFVTLGPDSYKECAHDNQFIDMHYLGDWMKQLHFLDPVVDREEVELVYKDFSVLKKEAELLSVSKIVIPQESGESSGTASLDPLVKPEDDKAVILRENGESSYSNTSKNISITLELIFGHAWKQIINDEICISIDEIQHRK